MKRTFGAFIKEKRTEKHLTLRGFSRLIGISPVYVSSIENENRAAPTDDILNKIIKVLVLKDEEQDLLYDLAAESKNSITLATDLLNYINENEVVHKALRVAKKYNANNDDWESFIENVSKKNL